MWNNATVTATTVQTLLAIVSDSNFSCNGRPLDRRPFVFSDVGIYSRRYVFPIQFIVGSSTNFLNFVVLTSREMRSKTNSFLAAMALADLLFFVVYLPMQLSSYNSFTLSEWYTHFYFNSHIPLFACTNWFSTASIWLTVAVTLERVTAVCFPLHARSIWKKSRVIFGIVSVYVLAFVMNVYHFFVRSVALVRSSPNSTSCKYRFLVTNPDQNPHTASYVNISTYLQFTLVLLIPLLLLVVLNSVLLHFLRKNRQDLHSKKFMGDSKTTSSSHLRQEFKVTCTVVTIILAFLVLNAPSGIVTTYELIMAGAYAKMPVGFYEITEMCNVLVVTGKMVNFFLYCFSSASFRRRLLEGLCHRNKRILKVFGKNVSASPTSRHTSLSYAATSRTASIQTGSSGSRKSYLRSASEKSEKRESIQMNQGPGGPKYSAGSLESMHRLSVDYQRLGNGYQPHVESPLVASEKSLLISEKKPLTNL